MKAVIVLLLVLVTGCTSIDYTNHVDGWPLLKEEIHVVSSQEMHKHCDKYAGFGEMIFACSEIYFISLVCKIWVTQGGGWAEEHERGHCQGFEHVGSDSMKQLLANSKK